MWKIKKKVFLLVNKINKGRILMIIVKINRMETMIRAMKASLRVA